MVSEDVSGVTYKLLRRDGVPTRGREGTGSLLLATSVFPFCQSSRSMNGIALDRGSSATPPLIEANGWVPAG